MRPRRPTRTAQLSLIALALALPGLLGACTHTPAGPPFEAAAAPPAHRGRVYVYRQDIRRSLATVHVSIDGLDVGRFSDLEYETLELATGVHTLRAGMRGFGYVAWGWNEHRFRVGPGQTVYLEISVRLQEHPTPAARELDIGGRPEGSASENVYISQPATRAALTALRTTTRLAPEATD